MDKNDKAQRATVLYNFSCARRGRIKIITLTFLRCLQRRRQSLVMLLHVVVVEQLSEWHLRFRRIANAPNVFH